MKLLRVLIADDEALLRLDLREMLEEAGHTVVGEAENGKIALELAGKEKPDLVIMDVKMPVMDGLEASRAIRESSHSDAKSIPIVALTANAFDEDVQRSMQAGLNAHLSKPIEPDLLFATLQELIKA